MLVHLLRWYDKRVVGDFDFLELQAVMSSDEASKRNAQFSSTADRFAATNENNLSFFGDDGTLRLEAKSASDDHQRLQLALPQTPKAAHACPEKARKSASAKQGLILHIYCMTRNRNFELWI